MTYGYLGVGREDDYLTTGPFPHPAGFLHPHFVCQFTAAFPLLPSVRDG